jgi:hypothetical protein
MKGILLLPLSLLISFSASAAILPAAVGPTSGDLKFNGTVAPSCNLMTFVDGTITTSADQTQLSSENSGGSPASVSLRANVNGYSLPLGAPIIIGPNGVLSDAIVTTSANGNGSDLFGVAVSQFGPDAASNTFFFDGGTYNIAVNANVTRQDGSAFPAGTYQLKIPVSCTM